MKQAVLSFGLFAALFLTNCTPYYLAGDFESQTADHQVVAILPFEMFYSGMRPEGLTDEDMISIETSESHAFQISFHNEVLRSTKSGRKPIAVSLQDHRKTVKLLEESGIGIRDSWDETPELLADILGVDAVVKGRIEKYRLMSDLASYGIDVAVHILDVITVHGIWPWLPYGITKSKEINASYTLIDSDGGKVLWSFAIEHEADWRLKSRDIIDSINRMSARKFPYRSHQQV